MRDTVDLRRRVGKGPGRGSSVHPRDRTPVGWPREGWLGVDVFFVVSGDVITGTLLRRAERAGRVRIGEFYLRRARRILPLALLVIATVALLAPRLYAGARADQIRSDGLWATFFAANPPLLADRLGLLHGDRQPQPAAAARL